MKRHTYVTACPRNCYSTCTFRVKVEENRITGIEPFEGNKATPEGPCLKGLSYIERVHSPERVLYPLKKTSNGFEQISWGEALDTLAAKLTFFKEAYGAQSVMFYSASGMSGLVNGLSSAFWKLYGGATTVYGNLCWPAGLEATRLTLGENKHNVPWDLAHAKLIILWGKNPAETNVQEMIFIEKAQEKGAKLVVIDPRRTPSSDQADWLIQPRPGTDAALALAIAHELIKNHRADYDFIQNYVKGFSEFKQHVESFTSEWASGITGVPVDDIRRLAGLIGEVRPMSLVPGYGMQRYTHGGQTIRCLLALQVLTGNIGKPGACWHYANLQSYVFDDILEPECYYPPERPDGIFRRAVSMADLGPDMLAQKDPELKMIWVERGNPLTQNPQTHNVREAFRRLEFRVVVEQFMTDTALEADIVLPAKTMFEQSDIIGSYWNPYVQLKQKVIDPPGEVKPETEIYYLLAQRLGYTDEEIENVIPKPGDASIDAWLQQFLDRYSLDLDTLKQGPVMAPGCQEIAFNDYVFRTPSGKIELYSEEAHKRWGVNELPTFEPLEEGEQKHITQSYPFYLMTPNTKDRIHSQFGNLNVIRMVAGEPSVTINVLDARDKGIEEGEMIRVYNGRGQLFGKVILDYSLRRGCVVIPNGYWSEEGLQANFLSAARETDMGHGSAFHDNKVNIEKAE